MKIYKTNDLKNIFLDLIMDTIKPNFFIEAGALNATFSRKIARILPETKVIAIEANPNNYSKICSKPYPENMSVYHKAVIEEFSKEVSFFIKKNSETAGNNSLLKKKRLKDDLYEEVKVEGIRLDTLLDLNNIDESSTVCLWVDLEGMGYEGLKSMGTRLKQCKAIYIEVEDNQIWKDQKTSKDILEFMTEQGFIAFGKDAQYKTQYNILFLRNE